MAEVQTARGSVDSVDSSQLGTTLMHEHVLELDPEIQQSYPDGWGSQEQRVTEAIAYQAGRKPKKDFRAAAYSLNPLLRRVRYQRASFLIMVAGVVMRRCYRDAASTAN